MGTVIVVISWLTYLKATLQKRNLLRFYACDTNCYQENRQKFPLLVSIQSRKF